MKEKYLLFLILPLLFLILLLSNPVGLKAQGQEVCPETGGDWVKVDGLSGLTYEYTAPEGKVVVESCYKAATEVKYEGCDSGVSPVLIESEVFNSPGGVICTAPGVPHEGCSLQDLSHASFKLENLEEEPVVEDDEPDVQGVTDEEVKGTTTVVMAETGASGSILVYIVQTILMLSTLVSGTLFVKEYTI